MTESNMRDFFISYTAADREWAVWIAVTLEQNDFAVLLQEWDFGPGADFIREMQRATEVTKQTIAVLSPDYFSSRFGAAEWGAAFVKDPGGDQKSLVPVRVRECEPVGMLASRVYINLVGLDENAARIVLLDGLRPGRRPTSAPFPGGSGGPILPKFPGETPRASGPTEHTADPDNWEKLSSHRQPLAPLLDSDAALVGHSAIQQELLTQLKTSDTATLVLLAGPAGSGKSTLLKWFERAAGGRSVVDVGAAVQHGHFESEVGELLRAIRPEFDAAGDNAVLVFDDIDHQLRDPDITRFVVEAIAQLDLGLLVLTTSTPLTPQLFPIPVTALRLDRRHAEFDEFDHYLDLILDAADEDRAAFSDDLRWSLHDMSEQTVTFRAVERVIEMLLAYRQFTGAVVHPAVLRRLLNGDLELRRMQLPAVRVRRDPRLSFRRKDKSELLAEVLLRRFNTPEALAEVAAEQLSGFDAEGFRADARDSPPSAAVLSLCMTYSPHDLVLKLLRPEDIRREMDLLQLDPRQMLDERPEKASLLVRGLGFTLVDTPKGLNDFKDAVQDARTVVEERSAQTVLLNTAGRTVIRHVRLALLDLLRFWATYLFGSVRKLVKRANSESGVGPLIDSRRLSIQDVVALLSYLDITAEAEESAYRLSFPEGNPPVPLTLLQACRDFARVADLFETSVRTGSRNNQASEGLRNRCRGLVDAAAEVLLRSENSFPSVIKLSEIVFDEYSRKIFHGVDSDNNRVRFAMTDNDDREELIVAAHYYMLPNKRVSVNPHIVPRGGVAAPVLFDRAKDYELASATQRRQGRRLLELVHLEPADSAVEVGSGTGWLALQIASSVQRVHGIDQSPDMVRQAEKNARVAEVDNVDFEVADLLEYDAQENFDIVLSNSSMHWILPEHQAYQQLYRLLRRGGRLAVHQGGEGNYRGLWKHTWNVINHLGYQDFYLGWNYPIYYPSRIEYQDLLEKVGFVDVKVFPSITNGSEHPDLVRDFSEAGLLPFLNKLPETHKESFRADWLEEAQYKSIDLYTHRLYAVATRP